MVWKEKPSNLRSTQYKDHKCVDIILYYKDGEDVKIAVTADDKKQNPTGASFERCPRGDEKCKEDGSVGTYDEAKDRCILHPDDDQKEAKTQGSGEVICRVAYFFSKQ